MKLTYTTILKNRYAWFLINKNNEAILIDAGDYVGIQNYIDANEIKLKYILITHNHYDHSDGLLELKQKNSAIAVSSESLFNAIVGVDIAINKTIELLEQKITIIEASGHSKYDNLFHFSELNILFTGDVLFSLGCGRVIEGDIKDLYSSMQTIANLHNKYPNLIICAGHNYFNQNLKFAKLTGFIEQGKYFETNAISSLNFELQYNVFLNANNSNFKTQLKYQNKSDFEFFTILRELKNNTRGS